MLYPLSYEGEPSAYERGLGPIVYDRWRRDGGQTTALGVAGPPFL